MSSPQFSFIFVEQSIKYCSYDDNGLGTKLFSIDGIGDGSGTLDDIPISTNKEKLDKNATNRQNLLNVAIV